ncbi:hypothetical protein [Polycladidibacter hongkongensis]|uniref:hypothetical protein n=1 Tax=Polycladidibacter hongkongensis TaxID=1647556 RepID=UPI00082A3D96|nr:hypothetical protein [Pseudovibrio hongkongensis]
MRIALLAGMTSIWLALSPGAASSYELLAWVVPEGNLKPYAVKTSGLESMQPKATKRMSLTPIEAHGKLLPFPAKSGALLPIELNRSINPGLIPYPVKTHAAKNYEI